jgi:gamma-tubulin complex component 3
MRVAGGQGDFVAALLERAGPALARPARGLSEYGLGGCLDGAVRASSAQYDDPGALGRLRVRLEPAAASERGAQGPPVLLLDPHSKIV